MLNKSKKETAQEKHCSHGGGGTQKNWNVFGQLSFNLDAESAEMV